MERVTYEIENRGAVMERIQGSGKVIVNDVTVDIVNGRFTTCYFDVEDAPATTAREDMLAALTLLGVEQEEEHG